MSSISMRRMPADTTVTSTIAQSTQPSGHYEVISPEARVKQQLESSPVREERSGSDDGQTTRLVLASIRPQPSALGCEPCESSKSRPRSGARFLSWFRRGVTADWNISNSSPKLWSRMDVVTKDRTTVESRFEASFIPRQMPSAARYLG
jgi:hypothetical protein